MKRRTLLLLVAGLAVIPACHRAARNRSSEEAEPATAVAPVAASAGAPTSGTPLPDGQMMPIADVMNRPDYASIVGNNVAFYFGETPTPTVEKNFGEAITNKKTNAFAKSADTACQWVMLSALKQMHDRAIEQGGNAVIHVHSYYKKNDVSDPSRYECHAGATVAGVALKGQVVKLAK
jgi:uncharacterized protein YbjQ (UPF0145 family)